MRNCRALRATVNGTGMEDLTAVPDLEKILELPGEVRRRAPQKIRARKGHAIRRVVQEKRNVFALKPAVPRQERHGGSVSLVPFRKGPGTLGCHRVAESPGREEGRILSGFSATLARHGSEEAPRVHPRAHKEVRARRVNNSPRQRVQRVVRLRMQEKLSRHGSDTRQVKFVHIPFTELVHHQTDTKCVRRNCRRVNP